MTSDKKFALLRIAFGCVWAIDAWLKWQPAFLNGFSDMLSSMLSGQPAWVQSWINFWAQMTNNDPHLFAIVVACIETAIALGLILGLFTHMTLIGSMIFALLLWSVGEAFGGPYVAGVSDIGAAVMYIFVAIGLYLGASWRAYSIDSILAQKFPNSSLWKKTGPQEVVMDKRDRVIILLIFAVIILCSILLTLHAPTSTAQMPSSSTAVGPGAMTPEGMVLKTYNLSPSDPVPTINFSMTRDPVAVGGWDVHITTTNFTFTPQYVNQTPVADQGHVHLYVDNTMYVVYGNWYHLDDLPAGSHLITVALVANDHSLFAENGQYVEATTTVTQ